MFSIRQLFVLLSGLYILIVFATLLLARWFWFYPVQLESYLAQQQRELTSLSRAMHARQNQLLAIATDYAYWSETWKFLQQGNDGYLQDNYTANSLLTLNIDALVLTDTELTARAAFWLNPAQQLDSAPPAFYDWLSDPATRDLLDAAQPVSDLIRIDDRAYLLAASPVLHTDLQGPSAGWLLFYQHIDDKMLTVLGHITRLQLQELPLPASTGVSPLPMEVPVAQVAASHQRCFFDHAHNPSFCLAFTHDTQGMPEFMNNGTLVVYALITLIPLLLFAFLMHLLTEPIRRATDLLERHNHQGSLRPVRLSAPLRIRELRQLRDAFNELVYTARRQQHHLEQLSNTDRLTNIPNRRAFDDALERTWRRIRRHTHAVALILIDIDYFKRYNDYYGHQAGDEALCRVAQALSRCARRADEMAARFGGEEFILIVYAEHEQDIRNVRDSLYQAVAALAIPHAGSPIHPALTISAGMAWIPSSGHWLDDFSSQDWLRAADEALYAAKGAGRNGSILQTITPQHPFTASPQSQRLPHSPSDVPHPPERHAPAQPPDDACH